MTVQDVAGNTALSFTVTGQAGSTGYGNITIPKNQVPYGTTPAIYIDNRSVDSQGYTQDANNYYVWYTAHFSTHQITVVFTGESQPSTDYTLPIALAIVIVISVVAVAGVLVWKRGKTKN